MALNLEYEFAYREKPVIPIRLTTGDGSITTEALLDTGADISLFDAELALPLRVRFSERWAYDVIAIGGTVQRIPRSEVHVSVLGVRDDQALVAQIWVGFVAGLAKTVGNLLGRNFLEHVDLGLHHHVFPARRRVYLGRV